MKLVEIINGYKTEKAVTDRIIEITQSLQKTPCVVNDYPGFIANRILMPMINEAIYSLYEGVATKEAIDTVMKLGMAHPMGPLQLADFIGSTTALLNFAIKSDKKEFIVATESGILHQMSKSAPNKTFIPAPPNNSCACNDCPHMKLNTLEKVYLCLLQVTPELLMDEELRRKAATPIRRMLEISATLGL
jgi:hypothetical protein